MRCGTLFALVALGLTAVAPARAAADDDGPRLRRACSWLDGTLRSDPGRDDAFGVVMRGLRERCDQAIGRLGDADNPPPPALVSRLADEIETLRVALAPIPEEIKAKARAPKSADAPPATGSAALEGVAGTWHQRTFERMGKSYRRTLELEQTGSVVAGTLYEETWYDAPASWVKASCDGKTVFRMVTAADVAGELDDRDLSLRREPTRVLACTCPSRCRRETRRRGISLDLSLDRRELLGGPRPYARELPNSAGGSAREETKAAAPPEPASLAGAWETEPFSSMGTRRVLRLELAIEGSAATGTLTEHVDRDLPLKSWSQRFCQGAERFTWVVSYPGTGEVEGTTIELDLEQPRYLACSCPNKCKPPKRIRGLSISLDENGRTLSAGGRVYHRPSAE